MSELDDPGGSRYSIVLDDEQSRPVDPAMLSGLATHGLSMLGVAAGAELSVVLVEPDRMAELKGRWLGEAVPTDVLAFPMDASAPPGEPHLLGDVVLCPAVAERQAADAGHTFDDEFRLLLVHGILHLLGHDHAETKERDVMQAEERRILGSFAGAAR